MNPAASADSPPQDVSGPVPNPQPNPPVSTDGLAPSLVGNIPVKTQAETPVPPQEPASEDDELDKIMQDVGHQLKKEDKAPSKKRRSLFGRKPKNQSETKHHTQPLPRPAAQPLQSSAQPQAAQPQPSAQPIDPKTSSAPVLVITLTVIVTGLLIIAAVYSYKK